MQTISSHLHIHTHRQRCLERTMRGITQKENIRHSEIPGLSSPSKCSSAVCAILCSMQCPSVLELSKFETRNAIYIHLSIYHAIQKYCPKLPRVRVEVGGVQNSPDFSGFVQLSMVVLSSHHMSIHVMGYTQYYSLVSDKCCPVSPVVQETKKYFPFSVI